MADPILVNEIISALGLTGSAAQKKRAELEKLSIDELNEIISNCSSFEKTNVGSLSSLEGTGSYKGEIFSTAIQQDGFLGVNFTNTNSANESNKINKTYNRMEKKELDHFLGDFIFNSTTEGLQEITSYNKGVGWLNVTDRAVNGFKVFTGQEDRIDLQNRLTKEQQEAKKLKDTAYSNPGSFESQIERKYGVIYNHQNVDNLKEVSQNYTKITACHEKYQQLQQGISEFEKIYEQEQKIKKAKTLNPAAAANLKSPEVSSDAKFAQIINDFCNGDETLIKQYMGKIAKKYNSLAEAKQHYPEILNQLKQDTNDFYKSELNGKTYQQYTNEYNAACKKVFGNHEEAKTMAKSFVENAKTQAAYTEIGITIATSLLLPGSSFVRNGVQKAAVKLGEKTAAQALKAGMTFGMGSAPAALSALNAATSEEGFSAEKIAEIKEKFKNGMIYGGFGAYASGPLGSAVEKVLSKNPAIFSNVISKTMSAATETSADVLFDRMTSDMSIKESLEQNGVMNFGMMIAGGRVHSSVEKLKNMNVEKLQNGTFNVKDKDGKVLFNAKDENTLAGYVLSKGAEKELTLSKPLEEPKLPPESVFSDVVDNTKVFLSNAGQKLKKTLKIESSVEKLFNGTTKKANEKVLREHLGDKNYSDEEIMSIVNASPQPIPSKVLYSLSKLDGVDYPNDFIDILKNIDTPDKLKSLELMIGADKIEYKDNQANLDTKSSFSQMEIDYIFNNLDSKITNFSDLVAAASEKADVLKAEGIGQSAFLRTYVGLFENNYQVEAFQELLKNSTDKVFLLEYYTDNTNIIKNIQSKEDLDFLKARLDNADNLQTAVYSFGLNYTNKPEAKKLYDLAANLKNDDGTKTYSDSDVFFRIMQPIIRGDVDFDLAQNLLNKKVESNQLKTIFELPKDKIGSNSPLYASLFKENLPEDFGNMFNIKIQNEAQTKAMKLLLDNNGEKNNRFEALAVKDILESINDENDLFKLEQLMHDKEISTFDLIKKMKEGHSNDSQPTASNKNFSDTDSMHEKFSDKENLTNYLLKLDVAKRHAPNVASQLLELKATNPKRFNKMVDSGLFELIEAGRLDVNILTNIDGNSFLSNRTLQDIRKLKNGEPLIKEFSEGTSRADFVSKVPDGEVGTINGKLYANDNGNLTEVNLSKEKFEELFPTVDRVTFEQAGLGDCYLVTTLDNMMDLPGGKIALYKLFRQEGNDVYIKFPSSDKEIKFTDSKVLDNGRNQIQGSNGIKMVEQAYAIHRLDNGSNAYNSEPTFDIIQQSANIETLMSRLRGGWQHEVVNEILGRPASVDHYGIDLNNKTTMKNAIVQHANDKNTLVFFATKNKSKNSSESLLNKEYDLYSSHAYSMKGYDEKSGMVYLTNPWHTKVVTEVPLYELIKYIDDVNFAQLR